MSENNGFATREQLIGIVPSRRFKEIELPMNGLKVRIRSLFEHESEAFQAEMFGRGGKVQKDKAVSIYRRLIVLCVCDEQGQPILSKNDTDSLNQWDVADINYLAKECESHCGFVEGEIEKTEKNLKNVPADK